MAGIEHEVSADYCQQSFECPSAVTESTQMQCACVIVYIQLSHHTPSMQVGVTGAVATGLFIGFLPGDWLEDGPQVHCDRLKLTCRRATLKYSQFNMLQQERKDRTSKPNNTQVDLLKQPSSSKQKPEKNQEIVFKRGREIKVAVGNLQAYANISKFAVLRVCVCVCVCEVWHAGLEMQPH